MNELIQLIINLPWDDAESFICHTALDAKAFLKKQEESLDYVYLYINSCGRLYNLRPYRHWCRLQVCH